MKEVDFSDVSMKPDALREVFGDGSVKLPEGVALHPESPTEVLELPEFYNQWRAWQESIGDRPRAPGE